MNKVLDEEIDAPDVGALVYASSGTLLGRIIDIKDHSDATRYFWISPESYD